MVYELQDNHFSRNVTVLGYCIVVIPQTGTSLILYGGSFMQEDWDLIILLGILGVALILVLGSRIEERLERLWRKEIEK